MKVTKIVENKNGMYSVYFDGVYAFLCTEKQISKYELVEGKAILKDSYQKLYNEIYQKGKDKALTRLTIKSDTKNGVFQSLVNKLFSEKMAKEIVLDLESKGYINDELFAKKYTYDQINLTNKSKKQIFYNLRKKGISIELANKSLDEAEIDDYEKCKILACKKINKHDLEDYKKKMKLMRYLSNKGFSIEIIKEVIHNIHDEIK